MDGMAAAGGGPGQFGGSRPGFRKGASNQGTEGHPLSADDRQRLQFRPDWLEKQFAETQQRLDQLDALEAQQAATVEGEQAPVETVTVEPGATAQGESDLPRHQEQPDKQ